jgi:hypothetical protein
MRHLGMCEAMQNYEDMRKHIRVRLEDGRKLNVGIDLKSLTPPQGLYYLI